MLTEAEGLFERFCDERVLEFRRLPEGDSSIPDYELRLRELTVAVEVEQLEPGEHDEENSDSPESRGAKARYLHVGRLRQKLRVGTKRLKNYTRKNFPGVVLLLDARGPTGSVDPIGIAHGMYGRNQTHTAIPKDPPVDPWITRLSRGTERAATDTRNTSLSAVAVLRASGTKPVLSLDVFHNRFAACPLPVESFRFDGVRHFAFASWDRQTLPNWVEM